MRIGGGSGTASAEMAKIGARYGSKPGPPAA